MIKSITCPGDSSGEEEQVTSFSIYICLNKLKDNKKNEIRVSYSSSCGSTVRAITREGHIIFGFTDIKTAGSLVSDGIDNLLVCSVGTKGIYLIDSCGDLKKKFRLPLSDEVEISSSLCLSKKTKILAVAAK